MSQGFTGIWKFPDDYLAQLHQVLVKEDAERELNEMCYRCVALQQFVSSDWLVQTRFAHIDVTVLRESREQGEECLWVHVIIIVHVTKPPEESQREEDILQFK